MTMNVAFVNIFCPNLIRTIEIENECNIYNHLLEKGTRMKKKQRKKKVVVHLLATDAEVIFWSSVFSNTALASSSVTSFYNTVFAAPPQHHLCNIVFCNIVSTLLLRCDFATMFNYVLITTLGS
jgi:hypothetical protein